MIIKPWTIRSPGICPHSLSLSLFALQSAAKFSEERATQCLAWIEAVLGRGLGVSEEGVLSQEQFQEVLKDGSVLCE